MGFSYTHSITELFFNGGGGPTTTFNGFYSGPLNAARTSATIGQPFADFLLGVSESIGGIASEDAGKFEPRRRYYHVFAQDSWELHRKLTLTLGLRYELNMPAYFADGRGIAYIEELPASQCTNFMTIRDRKLCRDVLAVYPANAKAAMDALLGGATYGFPHKFRDGDGLFNRDLNNAVPRLGIAWRATRRTVVRAGYGVFIEAAQQDLFTSAGLAAPFFRANNLSFDRAQPPTGRDGNVLGRIPLFSVQFDPSVPPASGGFIQAKWAEPNWVDGNVQSWNLNVQRLVSKSFNVQIGYVGNKLTHWPTGYATNIARPGPGMRLLPQLRRRSLPFPPARGRAAFRPRPELSRRLHVGQEPQQRAPAPGRVRPAGPEGAGRLGPPAQPVFHDRLRNPVWR
ncbi:MAG: hypothetical protein DMG07_06055 [Acidobacteria bacterium]|nr:MAG: hypothetical protein DMG07_06055 [Acidobacteriota bacterium]